MKTVKIQFQVQYRLDSFWYPLQDFKTKKGIMPTVLWPVSVTVTRLLSKQNKYKMYLYKLASL